jgi:hypothetical protein
MIDNDRRAGFSQRQCRRTPDSGRGACHDCHLVIQLDSGHGMPTGVKREAFPVCNACAMP